MIVRILDEGQYRIDSAHLDQLNEIDNMLVAVVASDGDRAFHDLYRQMLDLIHTHGTLLPDEELLTSDVVLPSPSMNLGEVKALFKGEGVVPG